MSPSLSPHETLFVPTAAVGWRSGPLPSSMIVGGALAMMIASFLPWYMAVDGSGITVLGAEGTLTLLLGALVVVTGLTLLKRPTQAARLLAGVSSVVTAGIGGNYVREIVQSATTPPFVWAGSPLRFYMYGTGLYVLGFGVVLILAGVVLQRPTP
jgi:hypothetical protein